MEPLMKKDLVEVINRQRSGTLAEYTAEPNVITEDIEDKVFDIVDVKGTAASIKRNGGETSLCLMVMQPAGSSYIQNGQMRFPGVN